MESNRKILKATLLKEVLLKKKELFGAFSATTTKATKTDAWKLIHAKAQALGLVPNSRDFSYTRDVLWQNIKKASVKKRDNSRQTGSGGGPSCKVTEVDELVYSIIGNESAVLDGLPVSESMPLEAENSTEPTGPSIVPTTPLPGFGAKTKSPELGSGTILGKTSKSPKNKTSNELDDLRKIKLQLTVKYLELKIKKLQKELNTDENTNQDQAHINYLEPEYLLESDSD